jgi:AcrR family transcriptional regulator
MPYPPEHRKETRARIIRSAQALFNRRGFTSVSIDEVMEHAGLTRGGFYNHFRTKSELYAEAVALALAVTPWSRWDGVTVDFAARDAARQVVNAYLSREHFDDVEGSCPMVTLPGDVARSGKVVRRSFEGVFKSMAGLFEESLKREGRADRQCALAIAGICVGGMVVARSVESAELADAIRTAARNTALQLGAWNENGTIDGPDVGPKARPPHGRRGSLRRKSASRG